MPQVDINALKERLGAVTDIQAAIAVLHWDQEVYMPPKAAPARGQQLATLSGLAHRMFTDPELGAQLEAARESADLPDDVRALVAETWYEYQRATKLPEAFVTKLAEEQSKAYQAWVKAREDSDFTQFQPNLEIILDLLRQQADYMGYEGSPYNALLEDYERGMTAEQLKIIFDELAPQQSAIVEQIMNAPDQPDNQWVQQDWDEQAQWEFTLQVLKDMGYDFEAGRQDKSVHPFTTNFDLYDVRITTRVDPHDPFSCLTGSIHEGGHALYEQGFLAKDQRTVLAQAPSLGIHESQSRMWENIIGRSLPFWQHYAPQLAEVFPSQLKGIGAERICRAINHVHPSLIRVEADECTYNLHVILRFEIEKALIEGDLKVGDIPKIWNEKVKDYLGLEVPNDAQGCLQDIHWSHGSMGYFPTYALGNLYAAQLFESIEAQLPDLWNQVALGQFAPLLGWLRDNVHQIGRRKTATAIVEDATGKPADSGAFIRYLKAKYGKLYNVAL